MAKFDNDYNKEILRRARPQIYNERDFQLYKFPLEPWDMSISETSPSLHMTSPWGLHIFNEHNELTGDADLTITDSANHIILGDTTNDHIVNLPSLDENHYGQIIHVVKTESSVGKVTVTPNGSDTIEGASSHALTSQWDKVTLLGSPKGWLSV